MAHSNYVGRGQPDELRQYIAPYVRWSWLLGLCVLLGVVGTYIVTKLQPPVYRATAILVVDAETAASPDEGTQLANTYAQLVTRPIVLQQATTLAGHVSESELATQVQSAAESGTGLIDVAVDDTSPTRAAARANAVATAFTSVLVTQGLGIKYPIVIFQQAVPPTAPDHPSPVRNAVIGGILAFALALALIYLLDRWDTTPQLAESSPERADVSSANGMVKEPVDLDSTTPIDTGSQSADSVRYGDGA